MKTVFASLCLFLLFSCNEKAHKQAEQKQDSLENAELKKVDQMFKDDDSILKAKEKELLKEYGN